MRIKTSVKYFLSLSALILAFALAPHIACAATLFLSPKAAELQIGQTISLEVRVNSEGQGFNAAQATIQFPQNILEVKSLDSSPAATIFNFWLEEPSFSNADGKITFIGGTTNGVVGSSIQILRVVFVAKGAGDGDVVVSDAAVTASDGSGTNILSTIETARFVVAPTTVAPGKQAPSALIPPPAPITREATLAKKLPGKPEISVSLYPDSEIWHNLTADFLVQWVLPNDISGISTALNKDAAFIPASKSEGLFDAKVFPMLEDGIWYLHVRFKNNVGWGPTTHYRLAVDTVPPLPFSIDVLEGFATDNPAPTLQFVTSDGLSGLRSYLVRVGDGDIMTAESGAFTLPLQSPGVKTVLVKARDLAGNVREDSVEIEILPIASPVITFVSKNIFVGEGDLMAAGTALPDERVLLSLKSKDGTVIAETTIENDEKGNWEAVLRGPFKKGQYFIEVLSQDKRGALSLPVRSKLFKIREKPLLTIAGIGITQFWFFVGLVLLMLGGFAAGWFSYQSWRKQTGRKTVIAQRDVINAFTSLKGGIDKMLKNYADKQIDEREAEEMEFLLKKMKTDLEKAQKYIVENIREISE